MTHSKNTLLLLMLFVCCLTFGQAKALDALVQKIDNDDAYIVFVKTMSPRVHDGTATDIIAIGKPATPQLIKVLESKTQGVIAHFILSEIWKATWEEAVCCDILSDGTTELVTINGLRIAIRNNHLVSKPEDLKANKKKWEKLLES